MAIAHLNGNRSAAGVLVFFLSGMAAPMVAAQHTHGILTPGVTFPKDDSVLTGPPRTITMSFRVDVRLLKLALYSAEGQWINNGFTYDPRQMDNNFVLP